MIDWERVGLRILAAIGIGLLVIAALCLLIVFVIPIALLCIFGVAAIVALGFSVYNYVHAIYENINFRHWDWNYGDEETREPARRSYFFGPGYVQMGRTIRGAFVRNYVTGREVCSTVWDWGSRDYNSEVVEILARIASIVFIVFASISFFAFSMVLTAAFSLLLGAVILLVMLVTYVIFSVVGISDRIYLKVKKISCDCPICHERSTIPVFICSECERRHYKLVPGVYGIWTHRCECGAKLPATFLNGRSKLASLCPVCKNPMAASDARPLSFQLVGGTRAGKTVYLTAFYHQYLERLQHKQNLNAYPPEGFKSYFDKLERWYQGMEVPPTEDTNAQMYPLLVDVPGDVKRMLTIYDIAGEMFDGVVSGREIVQKHFTYCDGFLFLLDPFSSGQLRKNREALREDVSDFSNVNADNVADDFISYCRRISDLDETKKIQTPVSVLIAKADKEEVYAAIGQERMDEILREDKQYSTFFGPEEEKRRLRQSIIDRECRSFLMNIGQQHIINRLDASFVEGKVHYYPISAMGHSPNGTPYEPWGTMEAVDAILSDSDKVFADLTAEIA